MPPKIITKPRTRQPNSYLVQGFRASALGVPKFKNPYPKFINGNQDNPARVKWDIGWQICFYGEELPCDT